MIFLLVLSQTKPSMKKQNKETQTPVYESEEGCRAITFLEQNRILKEIEDDRYKSFFIFCCCTGARVCEALSIKTADIDLKNHIIKIKMRDSKTKKHNRNIPFLHELLKDMDLSKKYLFEDITEDGSKQYFYQLYKRLTYNLSRHSTRHTFISVCSYLKIPPEQIKAWAGHTNLKMTTDTYTHCLVKGTSPILKYLTKLKKTVK